MNAICLVIDRLHAGYLGAYGNTWISTPAIDRLASEAFVFDHALIDSPRLEKLCESYWQGRHAMSPAADCPLPSLPERLAAADVTTMLLSDERRVLGHPLAVDFDDQIAIEPCWQPRVAETLEQTHLARCFAEMLTLLENAPSRFLLWSHLAGMGTIWDAPQPMRECQRDDDDPPARRTADVPDRLLPEDFDPDELLPVVQAYAAQVELFDACLGGLLEYLSESSVGRNTLLLLTAARSFPLGEHRQIGSGDEAIYGEVVQVPLIVRLPSQWPGTEPTGEASARSSERVSEVAPFETTGRTQALVHPPDVWATLVEAFGLSLSDMPPTAASLLPLVDDPWRPWRDRVGIVGPGRQRGLRTPAWYLRLTDRPELFVKPDDRWEANEVARRCPEVVEEMLAALNQYTQALQSDENPCDGSLSSLLLEGPS